jgi:hypothetical protein
MPFSRQSLSRLSASVLLRRSLATCDNISHATNYRIGSTGISLRVIACLRAISRVTCPGSNRSSSPRSAATGRGPPCPAGRTPAEQALAPPSRRPAGSFRSQTGVPRWPKQTDQSTPDSTSRLRACRSFQLIQPSRRLGISLPVWTSGTSLPGRPAAIRLELKMPGILGWRRNVTGGGLHLSRPRRERHFGGGAGAARRRGGFGSRRAP